MISLTVEPCRHENPSPIHGIPPDAQGVALVFTVLDAGKTDDQMLKTVAATA